jgi:polysaccharide biosynthesis transport protein
MKSMNVKEFSTLADYVAVLQRRKLVVLLPLILVPITAVLFSLQQHKVYEASADVLLSPSLAAALTGTTDPLSGAQPDRFMQTQAVLARVPSVLQSAVRKAGVPGETAGQLLDSSSVQPVLNADLLRFQVKSADSTVAVRLVNAYAQEYTRYRVQLDTSSLQQAKQEITGRLAQLRRTGVDLKSGLYTGLLDKEQQLTVLQSLQTGNTSLVQSANNAAQVAPRPSRNGILGLVLGAVLGLALAFLFEALDRRVHSYQEIEQALDIPLLGRLPKPPQQVGNGISPVMLTEPHSDEAGAVRRLKASFELANLSLRARTIMVTSAAPREGKSTTVANLAVAFAQGGDHVVLVDADIHNQTLTEFFGLHARRGFSDVALGSAQLEDAVASIRIPGVLGGRPAHSGDNGRTTLSGVLEVLPAGTAPQEAGAFLGTSNLNGVINQLRERADYVFLDAPPLLGVGDALALSATVDAVLLVARVEGMNRPMLEEFERAVAACPGPKLGLVITGGRLERSYGYPGGARRPTAEPRTGKPLPTR